MSYKEIPKFSTFRKRAKIGFQEDDKIATIRNEHIEIMIPKAHPAREYQGRKRVTNPRMPGMK